MSKPNLSKIAGSVQRSLAKHAPEILLGVGIGGMLTTVVLSVKATPKALKSIEERKLELFEEEKLGYDDEQNKIESLPALEVVKVCWKYYIPATTAFALSTACLIGASSIRSKRYAALATAYKLSETALTEYQDKVVETIGPKKEQAIRDDIDKDTVAKNPASTSEIIVTGNGKTRCYDKLSGRYFESDIESIRKAENTLNKRLMDEMYISLNEFYWELGLSSTDLGDEMGWNIDHGLIDLGFSSQISDDGVPALVINYRVAPRYH